MNEDGGSGSEMGLKIDRLVSEGVSGVGVKRDEGVREGGEILG